jgi:hypothetical protein
MPFVIDEWHLTLTGGVKKEYECTWHYIMTNLKCILKYFLCNINIYVSFGESVSI